MHGDEGDDLLYAIDNDDILNGGSGYDQVIVLTTNGVSLSMGSEVEYVAGNSGNDVLSAAATSTAIVIGGAGGDDTLTGSSAGDTLAGMDGTDTVNGGGGDDLLFAGAGSDDFFGGDGDDLIYILGNDDIINGGIGFDRAIILDTAGASVTLEAGIEYGAGNSGNDELDASGLTTAVTLGGAGGNDNVFGGSGNDTLSGAGGDDTLWGNGGADLMFGGDGNNWFFGGAGNDQFFLGANADRMFILDNSGVDAVVNFGTGTDLFDFNGHSSVNGMADLSITTVGSDVFVDFTGGQLYIQGAAGQVDASDFYFGV